jgi:hypothetical protein
VIDSPTLVGQKPTEFQESSSLAYKDYQNMSVLSNLPIYPILTHRIPIDFTVSNSNRYLSTLPIDPVNNTTFFYTYFPGGSYEVSALLKNPNTNSINDDDSLTGAFTLGSPNRS